MVRTTESVDEMSAGVGYFPVFLELPPWLWMLFNAVLYNIYVTEFDTSAWLTL